MTIGDVTLLLCLPLIPILWLMLNANRKSAGRSWMGELRACISALRGAVAAERDLWFCALAAFVTWKAVLHFWPLPDPFDAQNATATEHATVFFAWGVFFVWFGGLIYAGVRTLNRVADTLESV